MRVKYRSARFGFMWAAVLVCGSCAGGSARQMADPRFPIPVDRPAHTQARPRVVLDEAHENFHTVDGRYKPFAELLRSDGYDVVPGKDVFTQAGLSGARVLVIANAAGKDATDAASGPAFKDEECDAVRDWVRAGGRLLLVADHAPFGDAAASLAERFGVDMGRGFVFDRGHSEPANATWLVFAKDNGLLGDHSITRGRDASETVKRVVTFAGQSIGIPAGATALLTLGATAYEVRTRQDVPAAREAAAKGIPDQALARPVGSRAQAISMEFGQGRLVVLGEAAFLSAQVVRYEQNGNTVEIKMGMNVPGNDDRQFALNIMRWLSGALN